ncbi:glutamate 5-kinase [Ahrensia sp. R2A130]|uniref:glutamate 5-kinase n=1 Tax=Ahrensia sp. R2A130 TaxID=744979 RepID=UPI0001E0944E|nr:glutamate 5-kinase [Ahrensia sp. R2A130]EFL89585.1 glutamate 5-kinase [Ahrensia sp. R2A130]
MKHPRRHPSRVVIKVGSALLVDSGGKLREGWLATLAADIAQLRKDGAQVLLVSSGAIALGRAILGLPAAALKLDESQAAAAVGQIELGRAWSQALAAHNLVAGQILLTLRDTEGAQSRRSYLNARDTLERLLTFGAVPVVNENDTIATSEIRYGDNDRLAARVATMVEADRLILLSDIDGLYTAPPADNPSATLIPVVNTITPEIEAIAGSAGSALSRGGMKTKVEAARIAVQAGTEMVIASGKRDHPIAAIANGKAHTLFQAQRNGGHTSARKTWIAGQLETTGSVTLDAGAARALRKGNSLLPAGVTAVGGDFQRGDAISIHGSDGAVLGRGLAGYSATETRLIAGARSEDIEERLGYAGRPALVHRDDMALVASGS